MDLQAYLARIDFSGNTSPARSALDELLVAHMRAIPFENIDVITRGRVPLDRESLFDKIVVRRRGGYCYEHGLLFADALVELGYREIELLAARVRLRSSPGDPPTARTHLALRVTLDGSHYLVDPGFGGPGPQFAMPIDEATEHTGPGGTFRFVPAPMAHLALQRQSGDAFTDVYHLDLSPIAPIDVEVANHYTSTHPSSPFTRMLWVRTLETDGSRSLVNRELTVNRAGRREVRTIDNQAELVRVLGEQFELDAPELADADIPGF